MNIVEPILFHCRMTPDAPAVCVPGSKSEMITYGQLERYINNVSVAGLSLGLAPGDVIGIHVGDKVLHVAIILGLTRIGVVTFTCRSAAVPAMLKARAVLTDNPQAFPASQPTLHADPLWLLGDGRPPPLNRIPVGSYDDVFRINLTSGSTGIPRGAAFSHRSMVERIARYDYICGARFPASPRLYCDMGLAAAPSFQYLLYMLMRGGTMLLYGADGPSTIQAFDLYNIRNMVTSPHGLSEYLQFFESQNAVRCNFDHILVIGGLLSKELADRARIRMCSRIYSAYGATEVGTVTFGPAEVIADTSGAVGYVLPDVTVEIAGPNGEKLPPGKEGAVRIRTHDVQAYVGDDDQSGAKFRDNFFYPGDYGMLTEMGLLIVTGREETRLNLGGDKVNPELVEAAICALPDVTDAGVFTVANKLGIEELHAFIVTRADIAQDVLRRHCAARLEKGFIPVRFFEVDALPHNEFGKIDRLKLKQMALNLSF
ncbi:MAG: class I adenylate-forming enzyme family protein [Candidatus Binataceae bacterium]